MDKEFTDHIGRTVNISYPPKRIISLVPSQTELLHYLGLETEVVGITKFCIHPNEWYTNKTRVGGTKNVKFDVIEALQPDLIIANKEENEQEQIEALAEKFPVWISDIHTLDNALKMIVDIGLLTNTEAKSNQLVEEIKDRFSTLAKPNRTYKMAYFIWQNPYMVAGSNTFINDMLKRCGFENVFANIGRYPEINEEQLKEAQPELILLSSEPFPFKEKHIEQFKALCPNATIKIVDGELFSWYGSRLLQSPNYFKEILNSIP